MTFLRRLLSKLSGSGCEHLAFAGRPAKCFLQLNTETPGRPAAALSRHQCVVARNRRAVAQCSQKLACVAAAVQVQAQHVKVQQSAQPGRRGQSGSGTEPVKVVQMIPDALKREEHCL